MFKNNCFEEHLQTTASREMVLPTNLKRLKIVDNSAEAYPQATFTCSNLTIETLEQGVKYVQC